MKKIRINTGKVGLVFRHGDFQKVITQGTHWLGFFDEVEQFDMSEMFTPKQSLDVLLKDEKLDGLLTVVEVADDELALHYENGNMVGLLTPGRYAFWKGLVDYSFIKADLSKVEIDENITKLVMGRTEFLSYVRLFNVAPAENGILLIDNKNAGILGPGLHCYWKNATEVAVLKVGMHKQHMEISGQEILTHDKASLRISFFVQYQVVDIEKALLDNDNHEKQLYVLAQLALREYIGALELDALLGNKEGVTEYVMIALKDKAAGLGVETIHCGVRDIILPGDMKEIMNKVLVAQKEAQANVITRREETASTRSLLNTAKLMEENEMLFKLKEMEYVEKISDKIGQITVSGNGQVLDQLKALFSTGK
ncbi:MAG: slipin family protein [Cyclobacteriaceae bacterium]|nr:slipin family protein [Cyclobacteriaceae bacterium]